MGGNGVYICAAFRFVRSVDSAGENSSVGKRKHGKNREISLTEKIKFFILGNGMEVIMAEDKMKINYKIYMEAEDVSQSRILSTASYVSNLFLNCTNRYFQSAKLDNESDLEEFALRLYVEEDIAEESCSSPEDAKAFLMDMAEFLDAVAMAQSYLDMEGSFSISYQSVEE